MRRFLYGAAWSVAVGAGALLAQGAPPRPAAGPLKARAEIKGEGIAGLVTFTEEKNGEGTSVLITIMAKGSLTPGLHAVHLHAVGKCEAAFDTAGGHFDPGPSGNTDPDANHPFHMGDLPQLRVGPAGNVSYQARTTRVTLSDGPLSLFDADGTAIVVHANPDQGISGAPRSGVSGGPRVACGVIVRG